jgi:carboxypeptidase PM20D1
MVKKVAIFLVFAFVILIGILLFNTFRNAPQPIQLAKKGLELPDSAISHMQGAIRIKTITPSDTIHTDTATFTAFQRFIEKAYPLVHQQLKRTIIKDFHYIFEWKGKDSSLAPIILMGHYDVVPVEASAEKLWIANPFMGEMKDGSIWGRGTIDDKASVISIFEAVESLSKAGFTPKQNILLCFGGNEESSGTGAKAIVQYLAAKNIHPSMVLDEGGAITRENFKDVARPIAVIGVAEKGYVSFELSVEKPGGHSSQPVNETAIDILAKALVKLRQTPTPAKLLPVTHTFLSRVSASSNDFVRRLAISNLWLLDGMVISILGKLPAPNAMTRTTIVPTILNSGVRENVIPTNAIAIVNSRILPGDTRASVLAFVKNAINDERVKVNFKGDFNTEPSAITDIQSEAFKKVEGVIHQVTDSVITTPYLVLGGTDSRYYRAISEGVVNFSPVIDGKGYHGINEHLPISDYKRCFNFYISIIKD